MALLQNSQPINHNSSVYYRVAIKHGERQGMKSDLLIMGSRFNFQSMAYVASASAMLNILLAPSSSLTACKSILISIVSLFSDQENMLRFIND